MVARQCVWEQGITCYSENSVVVAAMKPKVLILIYQVKRFTAIEHWHSCRLALVLVRQAHFGSTPWLVPVLPMWWIAGSCYHGTPLLSALIICSYVFMYMCSRFVTLCLNGKYNIFRIFNDHVPYRYSSTLYCASLSVRCLRNVKGFGVKIRHKEEPILVFCMQV